MSSAFGTVVVVVALGAIFLSLTRAFSPLRAAQQLGRSGSWFDHEEDAGLEDRPDVNRNDPPIPQRRLRGRG